MGHSSSRLPPPPPVAPDNPSQSSPAEPEQPAPLPRIQPRRRPRPVSEILNPSRLHLSGVDPRRAFNRSSRIDPDRPSPALARSHSHREAQSQQQDTSQQQENNRNHRYFPRRIFETGNHHHGRGHHFGRRLLARFRREDAPLPHEDWQDDAQLNTRPRDSLEMTRAARQSSTSLNNRPTEDNNPPEINNETSDGFHVRTPTPLGGRELGHRPPSVASRQERPQSVVSSHLERSPSSISSRPDQVAERVNNLTPARELGSRLTASIRRRRARPNPHEDNAAMLQRLLSVAAAATAASLMGGNPESAVNDLRRAAVPVDAEDGSFDNFLQNLRNGRLASHLGRASESSSTENPNPNTNSLDFFRMFRFGPNRSNSQREPTSDIAEENENEGEEAQPAQRDNNTEGRTVSILIVGIRSLNNENESQPDQADTMPSFIDALTNLNTTINVGLQDQGNGSLSRGSRNSWGRTPSILNRQRRTSTGGLFSNRNTLSQLQGTGNTRPLSEIGPPRGGSTTPDLQPASSAARPTSIATLPESTPEPSEAETPRPRSPTVSTHSRSRLRESWPSRYSWRNSWSSRHRADSNTNRHSLVEPMPEEDEGEQPPPRRDRPRSEGEFLRFGSGSSRRNGIVEPDNSNQESNRSWIIYVLGGNYPEDHPILTTPSLFTDNPTYEDMLLLSSLLGPAKPPVAQQEEVDAAGGLFFLKANESELMARGMSPATPGGQLETFTLEPHQACQVCLVEFAGHELLRRLHRCHHYFHRACIDQWLTTGRNSCPLCRGPGVDETIPYAERPSERPVSLHEASASAPAEGSRLFRRSSSRRSTADRRSAADRPLSFSEASSSAAAAGVGGF